jgi:hypothetical protein
MGEPIAGRISPEAKERLEAEAAERGVSVSELTGSIVTLWLRKQAVDQADDPDDVKEGEPFDKSLEEVYDELEAVREVLKIVVDDTPNPSIRPWVERQVFNQKRGSSELDAPDYVGGGPY